MDTKDINISKSEEEALKIMGDTSSVTSGQIQSLKEDEECMQICSDIGGACHRDAESEKYTGN